MNKIYLLLLSFVCLFQAQSYAQDVPDFTAIDTEGKSYNLYKLLDEGKFVFVQMFCTW